MTLNPIQVQHFIAPRPGIPSISSANAVKIVVLEPNAAGVLEAQLPTETEGGSLAVEQASHQMLTRSTQGCNHMHPGCNQMRRDAPRPLTRSTQSANQKYPGCDTCNWPHAHARGMCTCQI